VEGNVYKGDTYVVLYATRDAPTGNARVYANVVILETGRARSSP